MSLNRNINIITSRRSAAGYSSEAIAYKNRVINDGGIVVDMDYVDSTITLLKSRNLYDAALLKNYVSPYFGVKKDGANAVSKLYDISLNNYDLAQATGANQPVWGSGKITYNGTSNYLRNNTIAPDFSGEDIGVTIIANGRIESGTGLKIGSGFRRASTSTPILEFLRVIDDFEHIIRSDAGTLVMDSAGASVANSTNYIFSEINTGGASPVNRRYLNKTQTEADLANDVGTITLDLYVHGAIDDSGSVTGFWHGELNDYCIIKSALSDTNRNLIEDHINTKYIIF